MTSILIDRVDGLSSAAAIKGPCRAATTANITLYGEQTIDGVAIVTGDRVLVKNQTAGYENGIYVADTGQWRRSKDFNRTNDVVKGTVIFVTDGTANDETLWVVMSDNRVVIGTTEIVFSQNVIIPPNDSVGPDQLQDDAVEPDKMDSDGDFQAIGFTVWTDGEYRTLRERARDVYCILDAPGSPDPTGTNDSTSSFQAMLAEGVHCEVVNGVYLITQQLVVPNGIEMRGQGGGYRFDMKTSLLFTGTGTKGEVLPDAVPTSIANPGIGEAYLADSGTRGDNYTTLDLTANFSAALILGKGSKLRNFGIYPALNGGLADYSNSSNFDMSDDWDVGVWAHNADHWSLANCVVAGHWRKAALLVSAQNPDGSLVGSNEKGQALHCDFQGFRGVAIRTAYPADGNYGLAGTDFINCDFRPLNHQSAHLATSSLLDAPFSAPSACLEVSGGTMRGVQFLNSTLIGRDDICAIFSRSSETLFLGCYLEAQNVKVNNVWLTDGEGSRMVATSNTTSIRMIGSSKFSIDMTPYQVRDVGLAVGRYTAEGVYNPVYSYDDDQDEQQFSSWKGPRLRGPEQGWRVLDEDGNASLQCTNEGILTAAAGYQMPSHTTAELTSAANAINTTGKFLGKMVLNSTTGIMMRANGSGTTSTWRDFMNGSTITPV